MTTQFAPTKVRPKSFKFATGIEWLEGKVGTLRAKDKPALRVAAPPEFKGEAGTWTPEDLFVAAVDACTMATFADLAARRHLPLVSYTSSAEGELEFIGDRYVFTQVILRPCVCVETTEAIDLARELLERAHRTCLVANSICSSVSMSPTIECCPPAS